MYRLAFFGRGSCSSYADVLSAALSALPSLQTNWHMAKGLDAGQASTSRRYNNISQSSIFSGPGAWNSRTSSAGANDFAKAAAAVTASSCSDRPPRIPPSPNDTRDLSTSSACPSSVASSGRHEPGAGPARMYWDKRHAGVYRADPRQELTIHKLQDLYKRLMEGAGQPRRLRGKRSGLTMVDAVAAQEDSGGGFWAGINSLITGSPGHDATTATTSNRPHIQGLYMYGGVGCGKTMLMDLFVEASPPELQVKRTHFHDFMLEVHTKLRDYKCDRDPLLRVADSIAKNVRVLAMDEFFVTDVADAMILHRLFGRLWDREVVLVATSNRQPDKLYEGGLQRSLFMPFIHRLKVECLEHDMHSKIDYRRLAHSQRGLYFSPPSGEEKLREEFERIAEDNGTEAAPETVQVAMGRHLDVALSAGKACMFTFADLCGRPVAAADYIALTEHYHTVALSGVPIFTSANVPLAYRFVTLIDVMYEHRVRLLISAEALPFDLFENIVSKADIAANPSIKEQPSIVVDDNLGFAKDRTISRLTEMQSLEYLLAHAQRHVPENLLALQEAKSRNKFWLSHHRKEH